jgi:hypothetical protein
MRKVLFLFALLAHTSNLFSQQFMTREGHVHFFSSTPMEDIEAEHDQMSAIFDSENGSFAFQAPILGFHFDRALMEEHFNENYLESEKFPYAIFEGSVSSWPLPEVKNDWVNVTAKGVLTIHGVGIERELESQMRFKAGNWELQSEFLVATNDHEIPIPRIVREKITKEISVSVHATLTPR